jgi:biotin carboxyl carrier protein
MKAEYHYQVGDDVKRVLVEGEAERLHVSIGDRWYDVTVRQFGHGFLNLELDGQQIQIHVVQADSRHYVAIAGEIWVIESQAAAKKGAGQTNSGAETSLDRLAATMPGVVVKVLVGQGDQVERGQTLVLLEAMKMELRISAPCAGYVRRVHCTEGQVVERGQKLVEIEAA